MRYLKFFFGLILIISLFRCAIPYKCKVQIESFKKNEIIMTDDLKNLLKAKPKPKLVIRVPQSSLFVTKAEILNPYINIIEKVFVKNNYIVRDRSLMENLLKSESSDFKSIGKKIDTDIIIDIISLKFDIPNRLYRFLNSKTNQIEHFKYRYNYIDCNLARLECRITLVEKGQLGGLFTFYISRCDIENLWFTLEPEKGLMCWSHHVNDKPVLKHLTVPFSTIKMKSYYTELLTNFLIKQLQSE